jgi:hypothetical protein
VANTISTGTSVVYVPFEGIGQETQIRAGVSWLRAQRGTPLLLLPQKSTLSANRLLPELTKGIPVATPRSVFSSGWSGGPVLAAWPTEEMLGCLSDRLGPRADGICVLMWGTFTYQAAWLQANQARHVSTGEVFGAPEDAALPPVVETAMRFLTDHVNHANGLVSSYDRDAAILTLQRLHAAGYSLDVNRLYTWSLANGFTHSEAGRLKDIAEKVERGHRFRLQHNIYRADIVSVWEAEAR